MAEVETQNNLDFERKHEKDLRRIRDFRLMDDNFMSKVFEDKLCHRTTAYIAMTDKAYPDHTNFKPPLP